MCVCVCFWQLIQHWWLQHLRHVWWPLCWSLPPGAWWTEWHHVLTARFYKLQSPSLSPSLTAGIPPSLSFGCLIICFNLCLITHLIYIKDLACAPSLSQSWARLWPASWEKWALHLLWKLLLHSAACQCSSAYWILKLKLILKWVSGVFELRSVWILLV